VKRNRGIMDFTATKTPEKDYFKGTPKDCDRCGGVHNVVKKIYSCGPRLIMVCPFSKPRTQFVSHKKFRLALAA